MHDETEIEAGTCTSQLVATNQDVRKLATIRMHRLSGTVSLFSWPAEIPEENAIDA